MSTATDIFDVFVSSNGPADGLTRELTEQLRKSGLTVFRVEEVVEQGANFSDIIWEALADCQAMVLVVSPDHALDSNTMIELGAVTAWNKPVYVLIDGPASTSVDESLRQYKVFPRTRLDDVVLAISKGGERFSEEELSQLKELYTKLRTPVDALSQSPTKIRQLSIEFASRANRQVPGDRLVSELLRIRKRGDLPRIRKGS